MDPDSSFLRSRTDGKTGSRAAGVKEGKKESEPGTKERKGEVEGSGKVEDSGEGEEAGEGEGKGEEKKGLEV